MISSFLSLKISLKSLFSISWGPIVEKLKVVSKFKPFTSSLNFSMSSFALLITMLLEKTSPRAIKLKLTFLAGFCPELSKYL